ncbi:MAG: Gfo/Idh/MocA family protein [Nitrospinota bacterium]
MKLKLPESLRSEPREEIPPLVAVAGADVSTAKAALTALNCLNSLGRIRLAGLWDSVKARREAASDLLGIPAESRFPDLEALLDAAAPNRRKGPDALLVMGPLATRTETIRKALANKIHVLCGAPLAQTSAEAESLVDAAAAAGVHLGALHIGRYQAIHSEALWAVRQRNLGEILFVRIERPRPRDPKTEATVGELLTDLYPDAYLARAWANSPVTSIYAREESHRSRNRPVSLSLLHLQHAGGGRSVLHQTDTVGPSLEVCEIHGAEGSIRLDRRENTWSICRGKEGAGGVLWERKEPGPEMLRGGVSLEALASETGARPYARALDDAFASFARGLPPPIDGREAWLNLRVMDAARESARTGEVVRVDIPFPR